MQLSLFLVSVLGALATSYQGHDVAGYEFQPVQEVYGEVTPPAARAYKSHRVSLFKEIRDKLIAQSRTRASASRWFGAAGGTASSEYEHLRVPENCIFPIDLLILQDATGSFQIDFELTVNNTLPAIDKVLPTRHPDSRISLVTFKDKPHYDLGEPTDWCVKVHALNEENAESLRPHYQSCPVGGGYDFPENQYGALMAVLNSPESIAWSRNPMATKLVIMITDAQPHFGGDAQQKLYPFLGDWGMGYDEHQEDQYCKERYYPTPETVRNAIYDAHTYFATIIVRPNDPVAKPLGAWQWFNSYVGFPETFVQPSTDNIEGWFDELLDILQAVEGEECVWEATTTPEPTTTSTTTEPATTTTEPTTTTTTTTESTTTPVPEAPTTATVQPTYPSEEPAAGTELTINCACPPTNPDCCQKAPEVLIALMKRPENLDIHLVGPEEPTY